MSILHGRIFYSVARSQNMLFQFFVWCWFSAKLLLPWPSYTSLLQTWTSINQQLISAYILIICVNLRVCKLAQWPLDIADGKTTILRCSYVVAAMMDDLFTVSYLLSVLIANTCFCSHTVCRLSIWISRSRACTAKAYFTWTHLLHYISPSHL